jgi:hypothetical protein
LKLYNSISILLHLYNIPIYDDDKMNSDAEGGDDENDGIDNNILLLLFK